jgi:dTDP-4-dehydrorhamnose reductase
VRILLVGAGGQLARALLEVLSQHQVTGVDLPEFDVTDLAQTRETVAGTRPELLLNASAYTAVDAAEREMETAFRVNALGPRNLALATAEAGIPLLHVSTDYVFDGEAARPYHEFDAPSPRSVYGRSKLAGEEAVRSLNPRHYVVRTAWLYAPWGKNFALTMRELARGPEVRVVSDQYGSPTYAPHLAQALARLIETRSFGTWHLAGSGGTSWYELARALYQELGIATPVRPIATADFPREAPRPRYAVLGSLQTPPLRLPPWREGVSAFAERLRAAEPAAAQPRTAAPSGG